MAQLSSTARYQRVMSCRKQTFRWQSSGCVQPSRVLINEADGAYRE
jgi:hypothetical protein